MNEQIVQEPKEDDQQFLGIENRLGPVESDVESWEEVSHKIQILSEAYTSKLNQVLEAVLRTKELLVPRQEIEARFENHENRISALEYSVRKTPEIIP